ncbi:MAG: glycosyltransferase family 39 protein [Acidobacteriota bacterium]|nr:glycosyltransferase family 39 protein [Blastocatellia bacterium]MDW8239702.1 glycosyltransferase family 39 protein [Acidobacteriota bacterium]
MATSIKQLSIFPAVRHPGRATWLLATILGLALCLRLYHLDYQNLWLDETLTWSDSQLPTYWLLRRAALNVHPPGSFLLLKAWTSVFGSSPFVLRLPFVLFSLLIILGSFALARRWFSAGTALLTAMLLALSPYQVYFAQEVRMYTMATALTLGAVLCYLRLRQQASASCVSQTGFCLFFIAALYTHYFTSFILAAVNIDFLRHYLRAKQRADEPATTLRRWLRLNAIIALACLPWLAFIISYPPTGRVSSDWRVATTIEDGLRQVWNLLFQMTMGYAIYPHELAHALANYRQYPDSAEARCYFQHRLMTAGLGMSLMIAVTLKGLWQIRRNGRELLGLFGIPLLLVMLVMLTWQREMVLSRYLMMISPYFFMMTAAGIVTLRNRWLKALITAALFVAMSLSLITYYQNPTREGDYRPIADLIRREYKTGDLIVVDPAYMDRTLQYYFRQDESIWRAVINTDAADTATNYLTVHRSLPRIWLILDYRSELFNMTDTALAELWPSYKIHLDQRLPTPTAKVRLLQLRRLEQEQGLPTAWNQSIFSLRNHAKTKKTSNQISKIFSAPLQTHSRATAR